MAEKRYWRIVTGPQRQPTEEIDARSIHLGDWLRKNYVSIGFSDLPPDEHQVSVDRFDEQMNIGDKIVAYGDNCVWAVGEVVSEAYDKDEKFLYPHRRDVDWYTITKTDVSRFPSSVRNKLTNSNAIMPLDYEDWDTIMSCL